MADTTLLIRAATAKDVIGLLKADKTIALAIQIADDQARAEVEIYAAERELEGVKYFDINSASSPDDADGDIAKVRRVLEYIRVRGDVFPWQLKRHISHPGLVQFVEKSQVAE